MGLFLINNLCSLGKIHVALKNDFILFGGIDLVNKEILCFAEDPP
jgi:hypothetical protein